MDTTFLFLKTKRDVHWKAKVMIVRKGEITGININYYKYFPPNAYLLYTCIIDNVY